MITSDMLASRTAAMNSSAIREILKVVARPGMVSLAGGIPSPQSFPLDLMALLNARVLEKYGAAALQYDPTEGFGPLRTALADILRGNGIPATSEEILVASGSQGVLNAVGMALISKGDHVAVESPTYLGALQAFSPYEPRYLGLETDDRGLLPESLERAARTASVKFVYLVPTFQNPTGRTLPLDRRRAVARILKAHDLLLVEDDPYGALRYQGEALPPIKTMAPDHVVYISTLSKIFAPGLRIGYCLAPEPLRRWLVIAKQGIDLHTSTYNQALAAEYLDGGFLDDHLPRIISLYRPRQQAMLEALAQYFPDGFHWSQPQGGMFVWVEGPPGMDMVAVYHQAVSRNVAFVPGTFFFAESDQGKETLRLNFTMAPEPVITQAIDTLGQVMAENMPQPARNRTSAQAVT